MRAVKHGFIVLVSVLGVLLMLGAVTGTGPFCNGPDCTFNSLTLSNGLNASGTFPGSGGSCTVVYNSGRVCLADGAGLPRISSSGGDVFIITDAGANIQIPGALPANGTIFAVHVPGNTSNYGEGNSALECRGQNTYSEGFCPMDGGTCWTGLSLAAGESVVAGTGTGSALLGGALSVNTTAVGNVGASGPDDLQTYPLPISSLITTGRCIEVTAVGTTANNANAKTVRLTIGPAPTVLITKLLTVSVAGTWKLTATICRTSLNNQTFWAEAYNYGGTVVTSVDSTTDFDEASFSTLTQTETNALTIKTQSTLSTADNDIVSQMLFIKYL